MKTEDLGKLAFIAIIIFVIYYIFTDMNDRRELNNFGNELNKITKEFNKAVNEDFKMKEEVIQKAIIPMTNDMKKLETDLNKTLKIFEEKPTIKVPQPKQESNIKIEMK